MWPSYSQGAILLAQRPAGGRVQGCVILAQFYGLYASVKKQQLEMDMEQWTGSKSGKEYIKAVYLTACLFNSLLI